MYYFSRLSLLATVLCAFSLDGQCMDNPDAQLSERLHTINAKTKQAFQSNTKKTFTTRYLDETIMLVDHKSKTGSLETLPRGFVERQIERTRKYAEKAKFSPQKKVFLEDIISDLKLSESQSVKNPLYHCTAMRLMALSCVDENKPIMTKDVLPTFLGRHKLDAEVFPYALNLKDYLDSYDEESQKFYSVLIHLNFEELMGYSTDNNYGLSRFFSPKGEVMIIDEKSFVGTQTISYGMLNDIHFLGASLDPEISVHRTLGYLGPWKVMKHDEEHTSIWNRAVGIVKNRGIYPLVMNSFMDIYETTLNEKELKLQKSLFDFLFILMHEDSPIANFDKTFKGKETVSKQDVFAQFADHLPGSNKPQIFKELGTLIAKNGYPEAGDVKTYHKAMNAYMVDTVKLLKERGVY